MKNDQRRLRRVLKSPQDLMTKRTGEQIAEKEHRDSHQERLLECTEQQVVDRLEEQILQLGEVIPRKRRVELLDGELGSCVMKEIVDVVWKEFLVEWIVNRSVLFSFFRTWKRPRK